MHDGPMCDLLWSNLDGVHHCLMHHASRPLTCHTEIQGWGLLPCGMEYLFSADIMKRFAYKNDIDLIAYMHQLAMEGFKLMFDCMIITMWSMPNYCYW